MIPYSLALAAAQSIEDKLVCWRRALHQIPEVGLELPKTRAYIHEELQRLGLLSMVRESNAGIWVNIPVGQPAKGASSQPSVRPDVILRVDMDGLAIEERTGLSFASEHAGFMHACGHDGHAAVGLGLAHLLSQAAGAGEVRSGQLPSLNRPVWLLFQAGEETLQGGRLAAEELIGEGIEGIKKEADGYGHNPLLPYGPIALSLHLDPALPEGKVALREGQMNAQVDGIEVTISGQGGHGAYPHLASDSILGASTFVSLVHAALSRSLSPAQRGILSFGQIKGGMAANVIPASVSLRGTLRTGSREVFQLVEKRLYEIAQGVGLALGLDIRIDLSQQCPAVMCHPGLVQWITELVKQALGKDGVVLLPDILMGGEDFAFLSRIMPAAMLRVGVGDGGQSAPSLHSPQFTFGEHILVKAVALLLYIVINYTRAARDTRALLQN